MSFIKVEIIIFNFINNRRLFMKIEIFARFYTKKICMKVLLIFVAKCE